MKLQASEFMPLTMERLDEDIQTPYGKGTLYSLCHYYEQNGDLMRDPEMCFLVVDNRKEETDFDFIGIYAQMYQQDNLGLYEESIRIDSGKLTSYIKVWQSGHCQFANQWLKNISQQGFLK
ncbi:hypothetical protein DC498_10710 [Terrimonas sp.]|nr:hypothetical protein DC498_10710 [Terrimonas sp.]